MKCVCQQLCVHGCSRVTESSVSLFLYKVPTSCLTPILQYPSQHMWVNKSSFTHITQLHNPRRACAARVTWLSICYQLWSVCSSWKLCHVLSEQFSLKSFRCRDPALPALYGYPSSAMRQNAHAPVYEPRGATPSRGRHGPAGLYSYSANIRAEGLHFSAFHWFPYFKEATSL